MPISFPPIDTISPFLFGREDYDLRDPEIKQTVKNLVLTNAGFYFRTILNFDFYQPFHMDWFNFEINNPKTLLLGPRGSLKCVHPLTLIAKDDRAEFAGALQAGDKITSIFNTNQSKINVVGSQPTSEVVKITIGPPFDLWIYTSTEHKFFCYDTIKKECCVLRADQLDWLSHILLLARPSNFKPIQKIFPEEIPGLTYEIVRGKIPPIILAADKESFCFLLKSLDLDYIRINFPWTFNTFQVLKFYHGMIRLDLEPCSRVIKNLLLTKSCNRDEIAFLLDEDSDYKPTPLQVNNEFTCFAPIASIDQVDILPLRFYDCNVSNSHYIANGFVTHNSTITTVGNVLRSALNDPERRFAIISSTSKLACGYVKKIKNICQTNNIIRYCFSDVIDPRKIQIWSNEALEFSRKSIHPEPTIWALGEGTDFTGFHFDEIHFDDLVTVKHRKSVTLRKHTWDWFRMTAIPAIEKHGGVAHVKGTRYHWDDMYGKLIEIFETTQGWNFLRTPACDEELLSKGIYKSFWQSRYPEEELMSIRTEYGEDVFWLQYMCAAGIIVSDSQINYISKLREKIIPVTEIEYITDIVLGVDLASRGSGEFALKDERKSSFSITAIGRHEKTGKWVVVETIKIRRPTLRDQREWLQMMFLKHNPFVAAVERNAYQSVFLEYIEEGDIPISVKPIKSFESKDARFEYVINMVLSDGIYFMEGTCEPLIEEILTYPENTSDCIDSLFFALRLGYREPRIRFISSDSIEEEDD